MPKARRLAIADIRVGKRLREDLGDLHDLAVSIDNRGLIHPIVVDGDNLLIAGHRRLKACKILGHEKIDTRSLGELTREERVEIELEENTKRKNLTAFEAAKVQHTEVEVARKVIEKEKAEEKAEPKVGKNGVSVPPRDKNPKGGRPRGSGKDEATVREVEKRTGISKGQQKRDTVHVETVERFPFMSVASWSQKDVLRAKGLVEGVESTEDAELERLMSEQGAPLAPTIVLPILERLSALTPKLRREIYTLHKSEDQLDRFHAIQIAADKELHPDPREVPLAMAIKELRRCVRKRDGLKERYVDLLDDARKLANDTEKQRQSCHKTLRKRIARHVSSLSEKS